MTWWRFTSHNWSIETGSSEWGDVEKVVKGFASNYNCTHVRYPSSEENGDYGYILYDVVGITDDNIQHVLGHVFEYSQENDDD